MTEFHSNIFYDSQREQEVAQPNSVEALAWLQSPDNVLRTFGGDGIRKGYAGKRAIHFLRRLYRRGAKKVTVVNIDRVQGNWIRQQAAEFGLPETDVSEGSDHLVVELPVELEKRAELIKQWVNTFGRKKWDVPTDIGQKYLLFWWD